MSTEVVVPFSLNSFGSVNTTSDPNLQAQQHLTALVATTPGERTMLPPYGTNVKSSIFSPDDQLQAALIQNQISTGLAMWEPNIDIQNVEIMPTGGVPAGEVGVNVNWIPRVPQSGSGTGVQTAVILVGGSVVEA